MKYGETSFDVLYLFFVIISGIALLLKSKDNKILKLMGTSALILGIGDAFHLVPRCLNYFVDKDLTAFLGVGKLVTSITITVFYLVILAILKKAGDKEYKDITILMYILTLCRVVLCLLPENNWITDASPYSIGILRNLPFFVMGAIMVKLLYDNRKVANFKPLWIYVLLSFIFYAVVVFGADFVTMLGMFMIPKTICYVLMIVTFNKYSRINTNK